MFIVYYLITTREKKIVIRKRKIFKVLRRIFVNEISITKNLKC